MDFALEHNLSIYPHTESLLGGSMCNPSFMMASSLICVLQVYGLEPVSPVEAFVYGKSTHVACFGRLLWTQTRLASILKSYGGEVSERSGRMCVALPAGVCDSAPF